MPSMALCSWQVSTECLDFSSSLTELKGCVSPPPALALLFPCWFWSPSYSWAWAVASHAARGTPRVGVMHCPGGKLLSVLTTVKADLPCLAQVGWEIKPCENLGARKEVQMD